MAESCPLFLWMGKGGTIERRDCGEQRQAMYNILYKGCSLFCLLFLFVGNRIFIIEKQDEIPNNREEVKCMMF